MKILALNSREDADRIYGEALSQSDFIVEYLSTDLSCPESILDSATPDIVILSLEWLPQHRIISAAARSRHIPTLYVMDGVLEWSYVWNNQSYIAPSGTMAQPLIASHIAVIGRHPARVLASMGLRERIRVIGIPRLDHSLKNRVTRVRQAPALVIACARTPSHNLEHEANVSRALSDLKTISEEIGVKPIWRIPANLAKKLQVEPTNDPLHVTLSDADALIAFPSTIALEGMLAGLPTALIEYRPIPLYIDSAWQIRAKEHIYPVLNELLYPPPEKMAYQEYCLGEELEEGEATKRLSQLVREIVRDGIANEVGEIPKPYGPLDFKLVHSQISSFSASPNAILQYEVDAHRAHRRHLQVLVSDLLGSWQIRLSRRLRWVPSFKKMNRILDLFVDN